MFQSCRILYKLQTNASCKAIHDTDIERHRYRLKRFQQCHFKDKDMLVLQGSNTPLWQTCLTNTQKQGNPVNENFGCCKITTLTWHHCDTIASLQTSTIRSMQLYITLQLSSIEIIMQNSLKSFSKHSGTLRPASLLAE